MASSRRLCTSMAGVILCLPLSLPAAGDIGVPIEINATWDEAAIGIDRQFTVTWSVVAGRPMEAVEVLIDVKGPVEVAQPDRIVVGQVDAHVPFEVTTMVTIKGGSWAQVAVSVKGVLSEFGTPVGRREVLSVLVSEQGVLSGLEHPLEIQSIAISAALRAGRITEEEAAARRRALATLPATDQRLPDRRPRRSVGDARLTVDPVVPEGWSPPRGTEGAVSFVVTGNVMFEDDDGDLFDAFGVGVEVWESDIGLDTLLAVTATDTDGHYGFSLSHDDGFGQGGPDIYVIFKLQNTDVRVTTIDDLLYSVTSATHENIAGGAVIVENLLCANDDQVPDEPGPACSVHTALTYIAAYTKVRHNNGSSISQVTCRWPHASGSFYSGGVIVLDPGDEFDWDVIFHEFGHHVQSEFDLSNNPGGPHCLHDCLTVTRCGTTVADKDGGTRLAWAEGWASIYGLMAQQWGVINTLGFDNVGDVYYTDTANQNFSINFESTNASDTGEDNEVAVGRLWWDLFDAAPEMNDPFLFGDQALFNLIRNASPVRLEDAWTLLRGSAMIPNVETQLALGRLTTHNRIGPDPLVPADGDEVTEKDADFDWRPRVGCAAPFEGNRFELVFWNPAGYAEILRIPVVVSHTYTLTDDQFNTVVAGSDNKNVIWAVEGWNTSVPETGPYLGNWHTLNIHCKADCAIPADSMVDVLDLLALISEWGCTGAGCRCDLDNDGVVSVPDLLVLLAAWGPCPAP